MCDDQRLYYLTDANQNVTSLVDTAGDAVEHYQYDPYGKLTIYNGTWSRTRNTSSYNNATLYTGRELDAESGIMHYRNRYYSTELGRFISRDPIGYEGSEWNLCEYVGSKPLISVDPIGLRQVCHIYLFGGHVWKIGSELDDLYPDGKLKCSVTAVGVVCCWSKQECAKYEDLPLLPGLPLDPGMITIGVGASKFLSGVKTAVSLAPGMCSKKKCEKKCTSISIVTKCDKTMEKALGKKKAKKYCNTYTVYNCATGKWK